MSDIIISSNIIDFIFFRLDSFGTSEVATISMTAFNQISRQVKNSLPFAEIPNFYYHILNYTQAYHQI